MLDEKRTRNQRLLAWFALNSAIFVACYLNYRLQLKHRYLYRTLSIGLCLSRAAAMVINFNLLLVWLPMCKYILTRLAVLASHSISGQRIRLERLATANSAAAPLKNPPNHRPNPTGPSVGGHRDKLPLPTRLARKLKQSVRSAILHFTWLVCTTRIKLTNVFLIAVDHCTSLHTVCATTITVASVVHTGAHLMNVINFSHKFDPLLGDLNMAEYRGQNPLQLLLSVPGITGCFMLVILFLMKLSSISIIRNSSYDLFQLFHRLSILFVILLILHPSSHVLKEQSNLDRHNPDFCYDKMVQLFNGQSNFPASRNKSVRWSDESVERVALRAEPAGTAGLQSANPQLVSESLSASDLQSESSTTLSSNGTRQDSLQETRENLSGLEGHVNINYNQTAANHDLKSEKRKREIEAQSGPPSEIELGAGEPSSSESQSSSSSSSDRESLSADELCLDLKPSFVAQSSICWYVLGGGLSCYLLDLLLRRLRRSKSPIELLDACTDAEGNLIELVLSNNHKRFSHWLPGQFVYLNCPQIATHEWHPFTISSMDNDTRQFTLHIKAGGDWTRKLRHELELRQQCRRQPALSSDLEPTNQSEKSMSWFDQQTREGAPKGYCCGQATQAVTLDSHSSANFRQNIQLGHRAAIARQDYSKIVNVVANLEEYDHKTGRLQVECKRLVQHSCQDNDPVGCLAAGREARKYANDCIKIDLDSIQCDRKLYSICPPMGQSGGLPVGGEARDKPGRGAGQNVSSGLDLFIDGPFHSPFERLLEQQVSVCIANGVGWTAFSSIFQQITNNLANDKKAADDAWWSRWRNFRPARLTRATHAAPEIITGFATSTKLHLMVIVTTMEQFKPFYNIVRKYYERLRGGAGSDGEVLFQNPIREVTAFITRSARRDSDVVEFCSKENLSLANQLGQDDGAETNTLRLDKTLVIHFGRPDFDKFLSKFDNLYSDKRKISVYCCGSYQVKRAVEEICKKLNRNKRDEGASPIYQYHEENF